MKKKQENRPYNKRPRPESYEAEEDLRSKLNSITKWSRWDRSSSDDESNMYMVNTTNRSSNNTPSADIMIYNTSVDFNVDSGSGKTLIDQNNYMRMGRPALLPTGMKLFPYGSPLPLEMLGKFTTTLRLKSNPAQRIEETIYVTKMLNSGCLLSNSASQRLHLIQLSSNINLVSKASQSSSADSFGKLKGVKIKLHIDENVKPVADPHRRIPYNLRKRVERELSNLEKLDIIERVRDEQTTWMSPIVIVPKNKKRFGDSAPDLNDPNEPIRICVDMRKPNTAIKRERHICPTIDDIAAAAAGSTVFSKIDLDQAYHQLELAEESRYITTFSTHIGLFKYKRLFFGVTSAAEIFQNTVQSILSGIKGVINASDDILIFGRSKEEHDKSLHQVLVRLKEHHLSINAKKMQLHQDKIKFFGIIIGKQGIELDQEKTIAISKCHKPTTKQDVRSFLDMVNYCSRFLDHYSDLTSPLRILTKDDQPFEWTHIHEEAFQKIKSALTSPPVMKFFNHNLATELIVGQPHRPRRHAHTTRPEQQHQHQRLRKQITERGRATVFADRARSPGRRLGL